MHTEMRRMTPTATRSTWLNPSGSPGTGIRHLLGASTPTAVPRYAVKLRATAALEKTYSMIRFAPVRNAANSPATSTAAQASRRRHDHDRTVKNTSNSKEKSLPGQRYYMRIARQMLGNLLGDQDGGNGGWD